MTTFEPPAAPVSDAEVAALTDLLAAGELCLLTGAGISTGSGIPDYRGPDGVRRVTPMELSDFLRHPEGRRRYWARASVGWRRFDRARPNEAHRQVVHLERLGLAPGLITQNVDGLHQRAGSAAPVELHGSLARVVCRACGLSLGREEVQAIIERDNPGHAEAGAAAALRPDGDVELPDDLEAGFVTPRCPACGEDVLKPDVVFFGESVPKDRVEHCYSLVDQARTLLVLGSSVTVMSSYRFVRHAVRTGKEVVVLTRGRTRADDDEVLKIDGLVAPTLSRALEALAER